MVSSSRFLRALVLSIWAYSFLFWAYVCFRLTIGQVIPFDPFIEGVPFFSFYITGIITFVISFLSMVIYMSVWGFSSGHEG